MKRYRVPCTDLESSIAHFESVSDFRLRSIYPADDPVYAVLEGSRGQMRLEEANDGKHFGEVSIDGLGQFEKNFPDLQMKVPQPEFSSHFYSLDSDPKQGRAGMKYFDLIPDRLGGFLIGSRIVIPGSGSVADYVHYHRLAFQVLYCLRGSALLVYENQGEPFVFEAGDLILQPPEIRHRVLESMHDLEVLEFSCPAQHETVKEKDFELPNESQVRGPLFSNQSFAHVRDLDIRGSRSLVSSSNKILSAYVLSEESSVIGVDSNEIAIGFVIEGSVEVTLGPVHRNLSVGETFIVRDEISIVGSPNLKAFLLTIDFGRVFETL